MWSKVLALPFKAWRCLVEHNQGKRDENAGNLPQVLKPAGGFLLVPNIFAQLFSHSQFIFIVNDKLAIVFWLRKPFSSEGVNLQSPILFAYPFCVIRVQPFLRLRDQSCFYWVQVNVTTQVNKVLVAIYKHRPESALEQRSFSLLLTIDCLHIRIE